MLTLVLLFAYFCGFSFILGFIPLSWEQRPTLGGSLGLSSPSPLSKKKTLFLKIRQVAFINKGFCKGALRQRLLKDLTIAHVKMSPEEFLLVKEALVVFVLLITFPSISSDMIIGWLCVGFVFGYIGPELWLRGKKKRVKASLVRELPDAIDLLGLCVNAGLDFMLSLKWVVEKSPPSVIIEELNTVLQEINVGKTRRDAIKDLALRYDLPDLSTFARTLIQADKMGTSVTEALNILSEDMRLARFRRGEQVAMKAPMKMLVPLLLFIFPVVGVLVAGPILLDFMENNPFQSM
ncbi:Type II/IV secretion system protein TadC, associated with Flp pilus assembly [hydrothermal vent metagenome]|uniref:Type II/IV secretion system protein TadC, associated with Flp pilus assembly n=1 Tax=hydrothermal vent metagenome TaxID=652676 RepID=A0A3B1D5W0_9ZZZZ